MKRKTLNGYAGLSYLELRDLPIRVSKDKDIGEVVDIVPADMEREICVEMINQRIPIRGLEVEFLRKAIGLSLEKFASQLDLSAASILKWERAQTKRLARINELAVRAMVAERMGLQPVRLSDIPDLASTPEKLVVDFKRAAAKKKAG